MIYFYYFGFVYLGYLVTLLFTKTRGALDVEFTADPIQIARQEEEQREIFNELHWIHKVKTTALILYIGIGIFFSDSRVGFLSLGILGIAYIWNKINKDDSSRRKIFAIIDVSRIALISIVLFDYFYTQNQ